jgi:O-methyltransferase
MPVRSTMIKLGTRALRLPQDPMANELVIPGATYAPWKSDTAFGDVYSRIRSSTYVDVYRCYELWSLVQQVSDVPGIILEVGVWRGGTGALLAGAARRADIAAEVVLCDTFAGVVKAGVHDPDYEGGEHSDTSVDMVHALLDELGLDNARILHGIFPDETAGAIEDAQVRFCHIDVDVYDSARDIFDWVMRRMPPGGIVVFDDYGFASCAGVTRLVDGLRSERSVRVIHNLNGHGIVVKLR